MSAVRIFTEATFYDLGRGRLRLDVGIECDSAFDLLNVLGDGGFAVDSWMDDLRNDACQWIWVRHGWIMNREFFNLKARESIEGHRGDVK